MRILYIVLFLIIGISSISAQVPSPGEAQSKPILITNITVHTGTGDVISDGAIVFKDGEIVSVGKSTEVDAPEGATEINGEGKHVYPGFILPNSKVGLVEVESVSATIDASEPITISPNIRSIIAYNTDSEIIPTLRFNGILLAQVTPTGGLIPGQSSIVQLDAWNWEDAVVSMDEGIHINWPMAKLPPRWWRNETEWRDNEDYDESINKIKELFIDATAYSQTDPTDENLKLEAMKGVFDGSKTLYVHANRAKEIISSLSFAVENGAKKVVLVGGADSRYILDFIKDNEIPIILADVHRLPMRAEEGVYDPYKLAGYLTNQGVKVALAYNSVANSRNLGFYAGTTAAYGLDKEEALKLITANPAEILGLDNYGTIEVGKSATFFISSGDALDMSGNEISHAFINGREVPLEALQQRLYEKYKKKYDLK
ncbi:amidohydrolase family protein [Mangrovivirga sp. M17]|uniref:Amidohydrolase family protein n=1 Tax=Mangrovivirga halotolerans TaxID=2993936 RepID=A0ABT3RRC0_9BACT|nr:amidohydrolase family protein [Mangrovivirga halotolerans]MCX2744326.1 amidohydrolase family protein [Mangrovivirga halotolerans]